MVRVEGNAPSHRAPKTRVPLLYDTLILVGGDGVEPPESSDSRFTVCPAAIYGISTHLLNINFYMAERVGYDPTHRDYRSTPLAGVPLKPA